MLSVAEAQKIVLEKARPLAPVTVSLLPPVPGLVLAEDVRSDLDMPPYDKALMDGYAVRCADLREGRAVLTVVEEITAGRTPQRSLAGGQAARIMTGAPIPPGADAVVMVERTRSLGETRVQVEDLAPKPGQNILNRAQEMRCGEVILPAGSVLRPQEFGLLATVGRTSVQAHPAPQVAVLSTGDEIVPPSEVPGPGQIRNGNASMLLAQVVRGGGMPRPLGIARDRVDSLRPLISEGLKADVLILSGGVSAGKLDLVPSVLSELGVQAHFHKVEMKPGKPVLFGTRDREDDPGPPRLVFGLPGNPVSALVCFELFVRPALNRLRAKKNPGPDMVRATLTADFPYRSDRPTYHPARLTLSPESGAGTYQVQPVPWFGSPDLRGLAGANAFVLLPAGDHKHRAGEVFPVLKVEDETCP